MSEGRVNSGTIVRILYNSLLNRDPDPQGFELYISNLEARKQTPHQIALDILGSAEFLQKQSTIEDDHGVVDTATITDTFRLLYGREPSSSQMGIMLKHGVDSASDRTQMARRIISCTDRQLLGTPY